MGFSPRGLPRVSPQISDFSVRLLCWKGKKGDLGGTPRARAERGTAESAARAWEEPESLRIPDFLPYNQPGPSARLPRRRKERIWVINLPSPDVFAVITLQEPAQIPPLGRLQEPEIPSQLPKFLPSSCGASELVPAKLLIPASPANLGRSLTSLLISLRPLLISLPPLLSARHQHER